MKKAFTIIEFIVVVVIIFILVNVGVLSVRKINERKSLIKSKSTLVETFLLYTEKSYLEGLEYEIVLDFDNYEVEVLEVLEDTSEEEVVTLKLPKNIEYYITRDSDGNREYEKITIKEKWADSFSIYLFDSNDDARYRISVDGINSSGITKVNLYKNLSANVTFLNVDTYSINYNDWEKE